MNGVDVAVDVGARSAVRCYSRLLSNVRTIRFAGAAAVALDLALGFWSRASSAQEVRQASITVPPVTRALASSTTQLSIQVSPQEALPKSSFIRFHGLPARPPMASVIKRDDECKLAGLFVP